MSLAAPWPRLALPALVLMACLTLWAPAQAEVYVSNGNGDPTEAALLAMLTGLNSVPAERLTTTARQVAFQAKEYEVDPFLLVAIMDREVAWDKVASAHEFAFNTTTGIQNFGTTATLPNPFNDIDTCAYALFLCKERFKNDINAVVTAYFAGFPQVETWEGRYPAEYSEMLNNIWTVVSTYKAPLKRQATIQAQPDPTSRGAFPQRDARPAMPVTTYSRAVTEAYTTNNTPPTEIEQAYIDTMRYFNRRISENTAREIYNSIARYAAEYPGTVDARLVMALVATESNFNPGAVSHAGAQGLGQLMPFTADSLNVSDPFDIDQNIRGTYAYLDREVKRWDGQSHLLDRVLAAYNAGPGAVERYDGIPPYEETQNYVRRVVNIYCAILQPHEREAHLRGNTRYDSQLLDGAGRQ